MLLFNSLEQITKKLLEITQKGRFKWKEPLMNVLAAPIWVCPVLATTAATEMLQGFSVISVMKKYQLAVFMIMTAKNFAKIA